MPNLPLPPSQLTGDTGDYFHLLWRTLNSMPNISAFSGTSPNSVVTGMPGDMAINIGSASTSSRLWIMGGSARQPSTTGWAVVRVLL